MSSENHNITGVLNLQHPVIILQDTKNKKQIYMHVFCIYTYLIMFNIFLILLICIVYKHASIVRLNNYRYYRNTVLYYERKYIERVEETGSVSMKTINFIFYHKFQGFSQIGQLPKFSSLPRGSGEKVTIKLLHKYSYRTQLQQINIWLCIAHASQHSTRPEKL